MKEIICPAKVGNYIVINYTGKLTFYCTCVLVEDVLVDNNSKLYILLSMECN